MKYIFSLLLVTLVPIGVLAASLADNLAGRILLQVEENGEAWYVNPVNDQRYFLGRPDDAWNLMRALGLGITNADINKIPVVTEFREGDLALRQRLSGRILLQVESHGEAWYVDPLTLRRDYLGRPTDAFNVMRKYGLGITNANLALLAGASDALSPPVTGEPEGVPSPRGEVVHVVPFTSQAPFGEWNDPRQQEGCEEASTLMAVSWARGETYTLQEAEDTIIDMARWEVDNYGTYFDTSAQDTADRLFKGYFGFDDVTVRSGISTDDIREELRNGNVVLVPVDGQDLNNPYFSGAGPLRHMIVIIGYDPDRDQFITHDPGTRSGANYRYSEATIANALGDYQTGNHAPITSRPKTMIVVAR